MLNLHIRDTFTTLIMLVLLTYLLKYIKEPHQLKQGLRLKQIITDIRITVQQDLQLGQLQNLIVKQ